MNRVERAPMFLLLVLLLSMASLTHSAGTGKNLNVVTTVAPITNIVRNIGASYVDEVPPVFRLLRGGVYATSFSFC
ncbi:MAG: hypothetical protein H0X43_13575 [Nitrosospira sp.]|nr:hypothetical protein [Nitrosospira sp.]